MAFTFVDPVACGEAAAPCTAKTTKKKGKALVVSDQTEHCDRDLVGDEYQSIAVASSPSVTELRSGSSSQPIKLSKLLTQSGGTILTIVSKRPDGTIHAWKPTPACYERRLKVLANGSIIAAPDRNSQIFDDTCVGTIAESTHIGMAKAFTDCDGATRFRLSLVEKSDFLDELIASGGDLVFETLTITGELIVDSFTIGGGATITGVLTALYDADFGTVNAASVNTVPVTINVPGAVQQDSVLIGWEFGLPPGVVPVNPHVSAADTVNVTIYNTTAGNIVVGLMSLRATVFKF